MLSGIVGMPLRNDVVLGIGDDASAWRTPGLIEIGTTDALVEGVHFTFDIATWRDLGWKALAINISDVAAMGGRPLYAMVSLGLPPETEVESVADLYRGMLEVAQRFDTDICGGNISSAPVVMVSVAVIGESSGRLLERSAALPGDLIAVTGYLGGASAGLRVLRSGQDTRGEAAAVLKKAHQRPYPRVSEGQVLVDEGANAAIDLSDGLLADLGHVAQASGLAATVRAHSVPVHPAAKDALGDESLALALSGGEDYELLFTARADVVDRVKGRVHCPVAVIGDILSGDAGKVTVVDENGLPLEPPETGWEHFRSA
jgi:thiamine-monophosphate kinase